MRYECYYTMYRKVQVTFVQDRDFIFRNYIVAVSVENIALVFLLLFRNLILNTTHKPYRVHTHAS